MAVSITKDVRLTRFGLDDDDYDEDDEGDDNFLYPYIYKPPDPPRAQETVTQLQVKKTTKRKLKNEMVCQYCGRKLTKKDRFSHNCRKKP